MAGVPGSAACEGSVSWVFRGWPWRSLCGRLPVTNGAAEPGTGGAGAGRLLSGLELMPSAAGGGGGTAVPGKGDGRHREDRSDGRIGSRRSRGGGHGAGGGGRLPGQEGAELTDGAHQRRGEDDGGVLVDPDLDQ